jgi:hypothetical protein
MKRFIFILLIFIGVKGFGQQPIFIAEGANIYSLNLTNCAYRFIGKSNVSAFNDIAFTPDGNLWGISSGLYKIDTSTAFATFIGISQVTSGAVSLVALNDSILLAEDFDSLWGINVKNAESYNMGNIGYVAVGDLSWLGNNLYMTGDNQLIKIVLNSDYSKVISATPLNSMNNPIPLCLGLTTATINGQDTLIGFAGLNAYTLSSINGTFNLFCSSIPSADGAASLSFPQNLPVSLIDFGYEILNTTVHLQWQTTSEINSSYFLIERSVDGVNFSGIGKVNAAGNSTALKQYSFIDNTPLNTNYYHLKEVDLDGKYTYSKILQVNIPQTQALILLGNPVQNNLQIQINNSTLSTNYLSIFDFSGRRLKTFNAQNGVQNIDVSFLSSGTYMLQLITADGKVFDKPFVKR